jgi:hypothetical protein
LVTVRTTPFEAVSAGGVAAAPLLLRGLGIRKTGMSRSEPVMDTLAARASTRALIWLWEPLLMIAVR